MSARLAWIVALALAPNGSAIADATVPAAPAASSAVVAPQAGKLEALVPELADHPYHLAPGERPFQNRFALSPGYGFFGSERFYTLRLAYNPGRWLGYEAAIGHNPGHSTHAVLHTVSMIARHPFPGRFQPYLSGGYGMIMVYPGHSVNAAPVTKNTLAYGGGLEFYIRSDLALRGEMRRATVIGSPRDHDGIIAYDYSQGTVGLAFYRSIKP